MRPGLLAAVGFLTFTAALAAGPISLMTPLIALLSSAVPVVVALVLGDHLEPIAWVAIVVAILGSVLIGLERRVDTRSARPRTLLFAAISGLAFGFATVALDLAPADAGMVAVFLDTTSGLVLLLVLPRPGAGASRRCGASMAVLDAHSDRIRSTRIPSTIAGGDACGRRVGALVVTAPRRGAGAGRRPPRRDGHPLGRRPTARRLLAGVAGLLIGGANVLLMLALHEGSVAVVAVLVNLYPVATVLLAWIVLRERINAVQGTGVVLAVAASACSDSSSVRSPRSRPTARPRRGSTMETTADLDLIGALWPGIGPRVPDLVGMSLAHRPGGPMPALALPCRHRALPLAALHSLLRERLLAAAAAIACSPAARPTATIGTAPTPADAAASGYPLTIDNCGTEVTFEAAPERVVTIKSSTLEMLLALGLDDRIVGTAFSDGPVPDEWADAASGIAVLSDKVPSQEATLALEPDLVFAGWESNLSAEGAGERDSSRTSASPATCRLPRARARATCRTRSLRRGLRRVRRGRRDLRRAGCRGRPRRGPARRARRDRADDAGLTALWYSSGNDTPTSAPASAHPR